MSLETLLRSTALTHGRIQLYVAGGRWNAAVAHFNGPMAFFDGQDHGDPVDALRAALLEDERIGREQADKYRTAMADASPAAAAPVDVMDLLG